MLCSLLNDWNYFLNKYCNLLFPAICRSLLPLFIFLASSWYQKAKIGLRLSLGNKKKKINYHIKGLYKTTCYKAKPNFSQFFFSQWELHKCFISFLIKHFQILKTWQDFIGKISLYIKMKKKIENTDRNILTKTSSFWHYFSLFRRSET